MSAAVAIAESIELCLSNLAFHAPYADLFADLVDEFFQHDLEFLRFENNGGEIGS